jgi:peptidoglycan hydrolase-like protein with peptidoglycan-binding domain
VEYAQKLLNHHVGANLPINGDFDGAMDKAVRTFQTKNKLLVDGVIGNQTWAALREDTPEKPSTDGRDPHTFVEQGTEARWFVESKINNLYEGDRDLLHLAVESVGDTPLDPTTEATVRVTPPGSAAHTTNVKLGASQRKGGAGFTHDAIIEGFRKRFPSVPPDAPITSYLVEAYLPADLGGDHYKGNVRQRGGDPAPAPTPGGGPDAKSRGADDK